MVSTCLVRLSNEYRLNKNKNNTRKIGLNSLIRIWYGDKFDKCDVHVVLLRKIRLVNHAISG